MKVTWKGTNYGQVGFHTELQEYDAVPPVDSLLMDHAPAFVNPEREAMAAYLAFGHWTSGDLQLPHRLGPNTATAIENDMKHVPVRPSPVEYYPKPLELGIREVYVGFTPADIRNDVPSIAILPASEWSGSMRALSSLAVASNAFVFDLAASPHPVIAIRARLAIALLFAGDLSADTLIVDGEGISDIERKRLSALFISVRIGIRFSTIRDDPNSRFSDGDYNHATTDLRK
ncbi:hypothetical protein [Brevibacterium metallidurans]|uniref:Uncharacterized protein n=1 Tax=Brevibacterium metallidurans TaxID=1482676 RepID=A0ABP3CDW5_9MICO